MSERTLEQIEGQAARIRGIQAELAIENRVLDKLMRKAKREQHSEREIALHTGGLLSNVSVGKRVAA